MCGKVDRYPGLTEVPDHPSPSAPTRPLVRKETGTLTNPNPKRGNPSLILVSQQTSSSKGEMFTETTGNPSWTNTDLAGDR